MHFPIPSTQNRLLGALFITLTLIAAFAVPHVAEALGPTVAQQNISNNSDHSEWPRVASGGGRLVAVWGERNKARIGFSTAAPDGSWSAADYLNVESTIKVQPPDVTVDPSGAAHLVYTTKTQVIYRNRPIGSGWSNPVVVATGQFPNQVRITRAPDGTLWTIWRDLDGTALFYRLSTDGGRTWQAFDERGIIAEEDYNMFSPSIAADAGSQVHVVWYIRAKGRNQGEIRYADWDGDKRKFVTGYVSHDGASFYDADPSIIVTPDNVQHVVWRKQNKGNWQIMHAIRTAGSGWQGAEMILRTTGDAQYAPSIGTTERGDILVVYSDPNTTARGAMLVAKSPGQPWGSYQISPGPRDSRTAVVGSMIGNNVFAHVIYEHEEGRDDGDIIAARVQVDYLPYSVPAPQPSNPAPSQPAPSQPAPNQPTNQPDNLDAAQQPASARADCTYFAQTQHNMCGAFRNYWQRFGGLEIYGYPLTEEYAANGVVTQYYERARFEYHPGTDAAHFNVLLGLLGSERVAGRREAGETAFQPVAAQAGCSYYEATQHNLCGAFRNYWQRFGGLSLYGYPLTEAFEENGQTVQYFERARFEYHRGSAPARFDVLAGRIGAEALGR